MDKLQLPGEEHATFLHALHAQWLTHDMTRLLLGELDAAVQNRHKAALRLRTDPAKAAEQLEREQQLSNLIQVIRTGNFFLPTNQKNKNLEL